MVDGDSDDGRVDTERVGADGADDTDGPEYEVNFRENPEAYEVGRGEQGAFKIQPYKDELLPHWEIKTLDGAKTAAKTLFERFQAYKADDDFVGMDMARKYLQMGGRGASATRSIPADRSTTTAPSASRRRGTTRRSTRSHRSIARISTGCRRTRRTPSARRRGRTTAASDGHTHGRPSRGVAVDGVFVSRRLRRGMGYHVVDPEELETVPDRPCELRRISAAAGLSQMAVNRFRADPGEQLPLAYHYHDEQEELFVVLEGTLSVETPERTYEVPAGSCFAVEPESPQRAYNPADADDRVTVVAVGAPAVTDVHGYDPDDVDADEES
jgi:uncharacterized cupin superfamily protein